MRLLLIVVYKIVRCSILGVHVGYIYIVLTMYIVSLHVLGRLTDYLK
jgi:hypothetical protein